MPNSDRSVLQVFTEVKDTIPQPDRAVGMFFGDEHGNLHRNDPRQMSFPIIRDVSATGEVRDIDTATGEVREVAAT